jgi:MoaA/NifB/PqqE/SkfB family radical SAM enzyme
MSRKYPCNRMQNLLSIFNALIFKNRPLYLHYGITHRCNLACRMCAIHGQAGREQELSLGQIEEKFTALKRRGVLYVSIGGGEPFLREDLPEVIRLLVRKKFNVRLLTNGTVADKNLIGKTIAAGLREVSISLDSLDPQKQDQICSGERVLEKVMRTMDIFSDNLAVPGRLLLINTVVSALNIKELPGLARLAKTRGYYISFVPVENHGPQDFGFKPGDHPAIDESYDYLIAEKKKAGSRIFNSSLFLEKSRSFLKSGRTQWSCDAGKLYFSMNPAGELGICHKFHGSLPGLTAEAKEIIPDFEAKRKKLIKGCPGCLRPCWAEISFLAQDKKSLWEMFKIRKGMLLSP